MKKIVFILIIFCVFMGCYHVTEDEDINYMRFTLDAKYKFENSFYFAISINGDYQRLIIVDYETFIKYDEGDILHHLYQ